MFGEGSFVPAPPIFVGFSSPDPKFGSSFYNPARSADAGVKLKEFALKLAEVFKFTSTSEDNAIKSYLEDELVEFNFSDYFKDVDISPSYSDDLTSGSIPGKDLVSMIMNAKTVKKTVEDSVMGGVGGERLNNAKDLFRSFGAYDSQILMPLLLAYNTQFKRISDSKDNIKDQSMSYLDGINASDVASLCDEYGVTKTGNTDNDRNALKDYVKAAINDLASYQGFDQDAFNKLSQQLKVTAVTPAIGMSGASMAGRAMSNMQNENYRVMKKQSEELEKEQKREAAKHASQARSIQQESISQSRAKTENMQKTQRRGKV